jgi:hypothetical protein
MTDNYPTEQDELYFLNYLINKPYLPLFVIIKGIFNTAFNRCPFFREERLTVNCY